MSIYKIKQHRNGYIIDDSTTDEEFRKAVDIHRVHSDIHCFICNEETAKRFHVGLFTKSIITINNHLGDGVIYFNAIY